jgi:hypothetical protein
VNDYRLANDRTLDHDGALDHDGTLDHHGGALPHDDALARRTSSAPDHDGQGTHQEATSKDCIFHNLILKQFECRQQFTSEGSLASHEL